MLSRKLLLIVYCVCVFRFFSMAEGSKVHISIVYACDDKYVMPTIVSMESAMRSKKDTSFYEFTILVPGEFKSREKFDIFRNKYNDECIVNIEDMGDVYKDCRAECWAITMYYRLDIPWILQDKAKAIYIDGDTLVRGDLQELWIIDLGDNLCGGVIDSDFNKWNEFKKFNPNCDKYINSGVLLINCKAWREVLFIREKIKEYCQNIKNYDFKYPDQDIINVICGGRIKKLPFKFMRLNVLEYSECNYEESKYASEFYTKDEFLEWRDNPVIVHYAGYGKPWLTNEGIPKKLYNEWHNLFDTINVEYKFNELKFKSRCCCNRCCCNCCSVG